MARSLLTFELLLGILACGATPVFGSALIPHMIARPACTAGRPSYLVSMFQQPLSQSVLQAGVPQTVQVQIVDDCGNPLKANNGGVAQVSFINPNTSIDLRDVGLGVWEATWTPNGPGSVTIQVVASEESPELNSAPSGIAVSVSVAADKSPGEISAVVNAARGAQGVPQVVSAGSYVAIYGTSLSEEANSAADVLPLPVVLNDTQLFLGGQPLRLTYTGPNQINALIPQNLTPNASYQLLIQHGSSLSVPTPVTVVTCQPGIFTSDLSGAGQGIVEIAGTTLLAAPTGEGSRPVHRGSEILAVFGTGFGTVVGGNGEAAPTDGTIAPIGTVYRTIANVSATIAGVNAPVVFSGLTPSLVALYQVNVLVPANVPIGNEVPLTLAVTDPSTGAEVLSNTVTIAVQ